LFIIVIIFPEKIREKENLKDSKYYNELYNDDDPYFSPP
jgi:hypothetical protein